MLPRVALLAERQRPADPTVCVLGASGLFCSFGTENVENGRLTLVNSVMEAHLFMPLLITCDTFEIVAAACGSYKAPEVGSRGEIIILF